MDVTNKKTPVKCKLNQEWLYKTQPANIYTSQWNFQAVMENRKYNRWWILSQGTVHSISSSNSVAHLNLRLPISTVMVHVPITKNNSRQQGFPWFYYFATPWFYYFAIIYYHTTPHHNLQSKHLFEQIQASWFKIVKICGFKLVTTKQQIGIEKQVCQWYLKVCVQTIRGAGNYLITVHTHAQQPVHSSLVKSFEIRFAAETQSALHNEHQNMAFSFIMLKSCEGTKQDKKEAMWDLNQVQS